MAGIGNAVRAVSRRTLVVWLALLVVLAAGVGVLWWIDHDHGQVDDARQAALAAARKQAVEVLSYSHRTVEDDLQRAQDSLTGDFRDEFAQLTADVIVPAATRDGITTKAEVSAAGVVSADADVVKTLLFVSQTTTSKRLSEPKIDGSRLEVTMTRVGDRWLISALDPV